MPGIGLDPLDATGAYNTPLTPEQRPGFVRWMAELSRVKRYPAWLDLADYDLRGAYLAQLARDSRGHMGDEFKKPNHPTFSDQSIYSTPEAQGGQWLAHWPGRWDFQAAPANFRYRSPTELGRYFQQQEPNSRLFLPPAIKSNGIGIGY
jgi:hypothetical protein